MRAIFTPDNLQSFINTELSRIEIPPGKKGVMVGYYLMDGRWRISAIQRMGENWMIGGSLGQDATDGKISGDIRVIGTW